MFITLTKSKVEDSDLFAEKMTRRDKTFARWLAYGHFLLIVYYVINIFRLIEFDHPEHGLYIVVLGQPYSYVCFPFICALWYCICYMDRLQKLRDCFDNCFKEDRTERVVPISSKEKDQKEGGQIQLTAEMKLAPI